jgi:hypothetical protein
VGDSIDSDGNNEKTYIMIHAHFVCEVSEVEFTGPLASFKGVEFAWSEV